MLNINQTYTYSDSVDKTNIASGRPAYKNPTSNKRNSNDAGFALDGNLKTQTRMEKGSGTMWWAVDLGRPYYVFSVHLHLRRREELTL